MNFERLESFFEEITKFLFVGAWSLLVFSEDLIDLDNIEIKIEKEGRSVGHDEYMQVMSLEALLRNNLDRGVGLYVPDLSLLIGNITGDLSDPNSGDDPSFAPKETRLIVNTSEKVGERSYQASNSETLPENEPSEQIGNQTNGPAPMSPPASPTNFRVKIINP